MKTAVVTIEGTSPILLHSPSGMQGRAKAGKKVIPTPEEEAAKARYLIPGTQMLAFPTYNFTQSILIAGRSVKVGKKYIGAYLAGCVTPAEEFASFETEKYEIDIRRAVIQRQGVMRARPRLNNWALTFKLNLDVENFLDGFTAEDLQPIIEEAGSRVGIGDFRPAKGGPFGRFKLISFNLI
jgi:hypothetical protein